MFGEGVFGDVIFADMATTFGPVPPTPTFTTPGDGQMIPLYRDTDDDEILLMLAAALK